MKNIFKNIIALVILGIAVFVFRGALVKSYFILQDRYFPCTRTISYSIGTVDSGFGISREDFLNAIKDGEDMWETSVNKDLFTYQKIGGELTINLVYDKRQANTQKLENINDSLQNNQISYNDLKNEVDRLKTEYQEKKSDFESKIVTLKNYQGKYSVENAALLNNMQSELNVIVNRINSSVDELNNSASSFNNQAKEYNNVGKEMGDEFEEGLYYSDKNGKHIDIYQFESKVKLTRVLMHELGHALSLDHINEPDAIMYQLNTGTNLDPTNNDIDALRAHCGIK